MPDLYQFTNNLDSGYAGITEFIFTPKIKKTADIEKVLWDFGDNTISTSFSTKHTYSAPGSYSVTLNLFGKSFGFITSTKIIEVKFLINESIYFHRIPPPAFAGHYNRYPFRIHITSSSLTDHYVNLGVQFSRSATPQIPENKWSFLKPQWNFFDLNNNPITSIKTTDTIMMADAAGNLTPNGTFVAGVTGYADFYFTDDIFNFDLAASNMPYSTIMATLDTLNSRDITIDSDILNPLPSSANSLAIATCPYILLWRAPGQLKITENGWRDYVNPRWIGVKNPIIINSSYSSSFPDSFPDDNGVKPLDESSYFNKGFPLSNGAPISLNVGFSAMSGLEIFPEPSFQWTDYSGNKTPGYYKGYFESPAFNTENVCITAAALIPTPLLTATFINPYLWISNPENGQIALVQHYPEAIRDQNLTNNLDNCFTYNFNVPIVTQGLSGFHGVYSIAALPMPGYHAWLLDSELQSVYRVNTKGEIKIYVDLLDMVNTRSLGTRVLDRISPGVMAVDGAENLWITLQDSTSCLKLNQKGEFISVASPYISSLSQTNTSFNYEIFETYCIDTDIQNNAFVTYVSPRSGCIIKYAPNNVIIYEVFQSLTKIPFEIVCDKFNCIWVSMKDPKSSNFYLEKYDGETFNLLENLDQKLASFGPFKNVNHLALDADQNLWFTYDYRSLGKIDSTTFEVKTTVVENEKSFAPNKYTTALNGLALNYNNKVYVINSVENKIYIYNGPTLTLEDTIVVNPQGFVFYPDSYKKTRFFYGDYNKSCQAHGDWTGFKWTNKYGFNFLPQYNLNSSVISLSGSSKLLNFYTSTSAAYGLEKHNSNYDIAAKLKELAFTPSVLESSFLFDEFLSSIFGKTSLDMGPSLFEKIANMPSNLSDIDSCSLRNLYDLAKMTDVEIDNFDLTFPPEIEKIINLASINLSRLLGSFETQGLEFKNYYNKSNFNRKSERLNPTYVVTAGKPLVLKLENFNSYRLVYTGPINSSSTYSLQTLANYLKLPINWTDLYSFYEYVPNSNLIQIDGVIDWENPYSTINPQNSSFNKWFGSEGYLETLFAYELYKGLNLLN